MMGMSGSMMGSSRPASNCLNAGGVAAGNALVMKTPARASLGRNVDPHHAEIFAGNDRTHADRERELLVHPELGLAPPAAWPEIARFRRQFAQCGGDLLAIAICAGQRDRV